MWIGKRRAQDHLNDYWNGLDRQMPPDELARLRAQIDPELTATIEKTRARFQRLRPDPAFSDRLEGELMNAFALSQGGTAALPRVPAPPSNGRHAPSTRSRWMPVVSDAHANRRGLAVQLGMIALLLLTLIGGFFVFSSRTGHPSLLHQATPVSTPTQDWTNTRGDAGRTGLGESGPVGQPVTIWRFQADGPCDTAPAAVGDTVYAACGNGILSAIDRATGIEQWQFDAQSPIGGGPTVVDGIVTLIDVDGQLYGVDAKTGAQVWVDEGLFTGAPVGQDGTLVAGGADGDLVALDVATGQERWRTTLDPGGEVKSPAIGDGIVYAGSVLSGFAAVDLATGAPVWHADTGGIETGTAVVANGVAYIGSAPGVAEGFLMAFDAKTGDQLWKSDQPIFTPAVQDGTGYAGSGGGEVTSIDLATGDVLWQTTVGGVARPAAVAGDVVYMNSDGDQAIYAFDTATGDQLWKFPVDGYLGDAPALKGGVLYASTGGGSIYALGGENAIPAAMMTAGTPSPSAASPASTPEASPAAGAQDAIASELHWSTQGGDGGFDMPGRVAIAPDGKIWVVDNGNHRFQIFDADGTFLETWGSQGKGNGEFQMLTRDRHPFGDIVFVPDGSFFVLDPGNGRVQKFGPDRQFLFSFGSFGTGDGQFTVPLDIALAPDGTLWVTDDKRQDAQQFDQDGTYLSSIPASGFYFAWDHLIDQQGNHYFSVAIDDGVTTTFDIVELAADGAFVRRFVNPLLDAPGLPDELTEMAIGPDGNVYAGSGIDHGSSVYVFSPDGALVGEIPTDADVQGVAFDAAGNMIVSASAASAASALSSYQVTSTTANTDPALLWTTPGGDTGFSQPGYVTIAPDGNIWVTDNDNHRFQIFAPDGTFIETWGEKGTGDGQFSMRDRDGNGLSTIAFAPDGTFFVLDPGNFRVQHFDADRQFITSFGSFGIDPGQFAGPTGMIVDDAGTVWVVDAGQDSVQHFAADGTVLNSFPVGGVLGGINGTSLIMAPDGTIYVTDCGGNCDTFALLHYSQDGTLLGTIEADPSAPWATHQAVGTAFDANGNLYVTTMIWNQPVGYVLEFDPSGELVTSWDIGGNPYGIALDGDGSVYIAQWTQDTLSKYELSNPEATPVA